MEKGKKGENERESDKEI